MKKSSGISYKKTAAAVVFTLTILAGSPQTFSKVNSTVEEGNHTYQRAAAAAAFYETFGFYPNQPPVASITINHPAGVTRWQGTTKNAWYQNKVVIRAADVPQWTSASVRMLAPHTRVYIETVGGGLKGASLKDFRS